MGSFMAPPHLSLSCVNGMTALPESVLSALCGLQSWDSGCQLAAATAASWDLAGPREEIVVLAHYCIYESLKQC